MKKYLTKYQLCQELGYETPGGVILFQSPFYKLICASLGIKYNLLSRTAKAMLRSHAIDAYYAKNDGDYFKDGTYYLNLK